MPTRPTLPGALPVPCLVLVALALTTLLATMVLAAEQAVFGPATYVVERGPIVESFALPPDITGPYRLHLENGDQAGDRGVLDATIALNGTRVASPIDFARGEFSVDRSITLAPHNVLDVSLASPSGGRLTLTLFGTAAPVAVTTLEPPLLPLATGSTAALIARLSRPAREAVALEATSSDPGVVQAATSIPVVPGTAEVSIPVAALAVGTASITARLNGTSAESNVIVANVAPTIATLFPPVVYMSQGSSAALTLSLTAAQQTDTLVTIGSSDASVVGLPLGTQVTVPAGALGHELPITAIAPGRAAITAVLAGSIAESRVTVVVAAPVVVNLLPAASVMAEGSRGFLALRVSATQPVPTEVEIVTSDVNILRVPGSAVTVPANESAVSFPVAAVNRGLATVTARIGASSTSAAVTVVPPPPAVQSLACPETMAVGAAGVCTIALTATQPGDTLIPLASQASDVVAVGPSAVVSAGSWTVEFPVRAMRPGQVVITAGPLQDSRQTAAIRVVPSSPQVLEAIPGSLALAVGATATMTLRLDAAHAEDVLIPLSASDSRVVHAPGTVTIPAGDIAAPVPVTGISPGVGILTLGPLHGSRAEVTVTVTEAAPRLVGLEPVSLELPKGRAGVLTLRIDVVQGEPVAVPLMSSVPAQADVGPAATIAAGEASTQVPVLARNLGRATITAGPVSGSVSRATVVVTSPAISALIVSPNLATVGTGATQAFTAAATLSDGTSRDVTAEVAWTSSDQAVAMCQATAGVVTAAAPGTATITAVHADGPTAWATLTVVADPLATPTASNPGAAQPSARSTTPGTSVSSAASAAPAESTQATAGGSGTELIGRVVDTDRRPIAGVTISMPLGTRELRTTTDATGHFRLANPPVGEHLVLIDGETAEPASAKYPTIPVTVRIRSTGVTPLHYVPHLHSQKDRHFTPISPGRETIATDPELPGVRLRIPADAQIIGWDGQANTKVSIRTVPIDRLPVPPVPAEVSARTVYMFYFGKKGGGVASRPIPFDAPNDLGLKPGEKADLWYFDESPLPGVGPNAWRRAGTGTVTSDGRTIQSDPDMGIPKFCCGSAVWSPRRVDIALAPGPTPQPCQEMPCGDPVDASTGIFILRATDLLLPGRLPTPLTRTYRSGDTFQGPFGLGTTHNFDDYLGAPSADTFIYVGAGNAKTTFTRQGDGAYVNTEVPFFRGARITVNADGTRVLRFRDGRALIFTAAGLQSRIRDRVGNEVTIERIVESSPTTIVEPGGRTLVFSWAIDPSPNVRDRVTSVRDSLGRTVTYGYDSQRRLTTVTTPAGVTRYAYDDQHRMTSITNPRGIVYVQNTYDVNSRVCRQLYADTTTLTYYYITADRATLPESELLLSEAAAGGSISAPPCSATASTAVVVATVIVDGRGKPTTYRFNGQGFVVQRTDALGQVTSYERQGGTNLLLSVTDTLNRVTRYQYDANGNITQFVDAMNQTSSFTYDTIYSRVTSSTDPLGHTTTFEYDNQGNLTAVTDPEENTKPEAERRKTRIASNAFGQPVSVTDLLDQVTQFAYSAEGDLISVTDPLGRVTQNQYDLASRLIARIDPLGRVTRFSYDSMNRLVSILDPINGTTTLGRDANGNILTVKDARGNITRQEYDALDRLSRRTDALSRVEAFGYDGNGNLATTTSRKNQTTTFGYDALNRRTQATYADGTSASLTYDAGSRLTGIDDTADPHRPIVRTYDARDRMLSETTSLGALSYEYDIAGRRTSMTATGQPRVTYGYNAGSRLVTITQGPLNAVLDYDAQGRRTLLTLPNEVTVEYQYDAASQLIGLVYRNALGTTLGNLQYAYDRNGNRLATSGSWARTALPAAVASSSYNQSNAQLTFGAVSQTFDPNGAMLSQTTTAGVTTYTWDARNRLTAIAGPGVNTTFEYDGFGRRAVKTINGQQTQFAYDGLDIIWERTSVDKASYLRSPIVDETLSRSDSTATLSYLADALGSTLGLADAAGSVPAAYTFAPFGETTFSGTPTANAMQFTGRENDGTGLYYYRARYYDPVRSRFISEDPIGFTGGFNLYSYAHNQPANAVDPLGLFGIGLAAGGNHLGHSDFPGADRFDYNKEDRGWTHPWNPFSMCRHFRPFHEIRPDLESAIDNCDRDSFERLMHQGQDFFSHYREGYRCYSDFGNRVPGHLTGVPDRSVNNWMDAYELTRQMVRKWDERCNCARRLRE